jgi:hypothetical protein
MKKESMKKVVLFLKGVTVGLILGLIFRVL